MVVDAAELIRRYQAGERDFSAVSLPSADFSWATLKAVGLARATLVDADFSFADLEEADLRNANLRGAQLGGANLSYATLDAVDLGEASLNGARFNGARLASVNLSGANLESASLRQADLRGAVLRGARLHRAELNGAYLGDVDLRSVRATAADLNGAELSGADLSSAVLDGADFNGAKLIGANLDNASLDGADLANADLRGANLSGASLRRANLSNANLKDVVFRSADLDAAIFLDAMLRSVDFGDLRSADGALFGGTSFEDVSFGLLCGARLEHARPSSVDVRSTLRSIHTPGLKEFLRATGMPDVFVEYMVDCAKSLDPNELFSLLQSTFISYGGPDEKFARKLNDALERRGVTTFFFKDDAVPGERLHRVMRRGIGEYARVILICSRSSLERPGLLNELEETLAREARDGGSTYLIPIRLDDHVTTGWRPDRPDLAQAVRDRVIADFSGHENAKEFDAAVSRLVSALKKPVRRPA